VFYGIVPWVGTQRKRKASVVGVFGREKDRDRLRVSATDYDND
jgi:hypothetical protein